MYTGAFRSTPPPPEVDRSRCENLCRQSHPFLLAVAFVSLISTHRLCLFATLSRNRLHALIVFQRSFQNMFHLKLVRDPYPPSEKSKTERQTSGSNHTASNYALDGNSVPIIPRALSVHSQTGNGREGSTPMRFCINFNAEMWQTI